VLRIGKQMHCVVHWTKHLQCFGLTTSRGCRNRKSRRLTAVNQTSFGPFDFVQRAGVGSCGAVLHVRTRDSVGALKCIRRTPSAQDIPTVQKWLNRRLSSELRALQMLNHPFIVGLKGHTTTQTHLCLLLEYVPERSPTGCNYCLSIPSFPCSWY